MKKQEIIDYLNKPSDDRPGVFFDSKRMDFQAELGMDVLARLNELFPKPRAMSHRQRFEFLVNLTYASSRLEGNAYSQIDTRTLLEDGIVAEGMSEEDTKMLINHKHAFDLMIHSGKVDRETICEIHRNLADNSGVEGSRHFLDPDLGGKVRSYTDLWIGNTSYIPLVDHPSSAKGKISDWLDYAIEQANHAKSPFESAFYLFTRLPYLQAFNDCNKRTSRLAGNIPLLNSGKYPISFMSFERESYNKSIVAFYELGDTSLFKEGFVRSYINSALKFHGFSSGFMLQAHKDTVQDIVIKASLYVLDREENHVSELLLNEAKSRVADSDISPSL